MQAKSSKIIMLKRTLEAYQIQNKREGVNEDHLILDTQRLLDNEMAAHQAHQFQQNLLKFDKVTTSLHALID
jgi:hypothetical protein